MVSPVVYYLSLKPETPPKDYWDYGLIYDLLAPFKYKELSALPYKEMGIVVIPARHHDDMVKEINTELAKIKKVVLFLMGDEEGAFPIEKIKHDDIYFWVQNPQPGRHNDFVKLGTGYPPQIKECTELPEKDLDWFFAGQVTHQRREQCVAQLENMKGGEMLGTEGFTQGMPHKEYFAKLARAKVAPCPSGPETPDSFRLFEALELGCVPIADTQTPKKDWDGFWEWLFEEPVPFTPISSWESLPGYTKGLVKEYPQLNNRVQAWWMRYKRNLHHTLYNQLGITEEVIAIIPVSPIPGHPDTSILEETISSIRHHHPKSEIIITFDGVREEQEDRRADYEEHIRRILWKARDWNVKPFIFEEHRHQVGMMKAIMDEVKTPYILYMEQDAPLVTDEPIEWDKVKSKLASGDSNLVRFHFESAIHPEHKHLSLDQEPVDGFVRTAQWSQRPHLASTAFYRRMLNENFTKKAKCFIEDLVHGKLHQAFITDGEQGWNQWRVHIYHPEGHIKRSYHTDGREGAEKFDDSQVW